MNIDKILKEDYDFLLTCPPYADLEIYSDNPKDLSNMPYDKYIESYSKIIYKSVSRLKENAFAAIVVGDVRDKKDHYYGLVPDTIDIFKKAGLHYYNECILLESLATNAIRAGKQFNSKRKVCKCHQNVLIFLKGGEKQIMDYLNNYEYNFDEYISSLE